eukprot:scaffold26115_cov132-Cylindrotheca_fusiformis.AAC.6
MGCNPSVSEGVPVTIGWKYFDEYDVDIDVYESASNKGEDRSSAGGLCPRLDVTRRAKILLNQGYKMLEIVECTLQVLDAQHKRTESVRNRKWDGFHSFLEVTKRRLKKTSTLGYSGGSSSSSKATMLPRIAPAVPVSSPAISSSSRKRSNRRGSLLGTSSDDMRPTRRSSMEEEESSSTSLFPNKNVGPPRRRASLDLGPMKPNADWALTA